MANHDHSDDEIDLEDMSDREATADIVRSGPRSNAKHKRHFPSLLLEFASARPVGKMKQFGDGTRRGARKNFRGRSKGGGGEEAG